MAKKKYPSRLETGGPLAKDNLQLINGIGPTAEKRLNGVGIYTFTQLAALSPADIAAAIADLSGLSAERIIKQDWIGQARKLAAESVASEAQQGVEIPEVTGPSLNLNASVEPLAADLIEHADAIAPSVESENVAVTLKGNYHPATFAVDFLLDEHNYVHSIHVLHIESRHEHTWTGWQKSQLEDFLRLRAGVNIPLDKRPLLDTEDAVHAFKIIAEDNSPTLRAARPKLTGVLQLLNMKAVGGELIGPGRILIHDEYFDIRLTLDLTRLQMPGGTPLNYKASIYGKGQGRPGLVVGKAEGTIMPTDRVTITVRGNTLPEGIYRLAATVTVGQPDTKLRAQPRTVGVIDGGLVQVY